jgi:transcriptional regulator with XRE-family HTH domain
MNKKTDLEKEILESFANIPTTEEILKQLKKETFPNLDNDPNFVADFAKSLVTEDILAAMEAEGINKSQLAKMLGKSRQYISRVLNETANFTIDSLAEIACALNRKIEVRIIDKKQHVFLAENYRPAPKASGYSNDFSYSSRAANIPTLNDDSFMVAEEQTLYNIDKGAKYEKLKFAS